MSKTRDQAEFGDFQTPMELANRVTTLLAHRGVRPTSVVEPTCGIGNFLLSSLDSFPSTTHALALDINDKYLATVRERLAVKGDNRVTLLPGSFFDADWQTLLARLPEPILVIGNPPWVTNSELGTLGSANLPEKNNFQKHAGFDALTGKSNFDISEWMILRMLEWLSSRRATIAMLCKTSVARKILLHAWKNGLPISDSSLYRIDAAGHFAAAVDACLFVCAYDDRQPNFACRLYPDLSSTEPVSIIGYSDGRLLSDVMEYKRWRHLEGEDSYKWRSGIKHDCSKVMELRRDADRYRNGLGELVQLEADFIYPMLKSSEVVKAGSSPTRWMLVPQRSTGEGTDAIQQSAPMTWRYLCAHGDKLDGRGSSIYAGRPRFSVFGIGEYSFAPWKVAISGLYKQLTFNVIGPFANMPVVLDDTSYFLSCDDEEEARYLSSLLNSAPAQGFLRSLVFWDSKRPITADLLRRISLVELARELGSETTMQGYLSKRTPLPVPQASSQRQQLLPL